MAGSSALPPAIHAAKVANALQALTHSSKGWKCPGCGAMQAGTGHCTKCNKDLVETPVDVQPVRDASVDAATHVLHLSLASGQSIDLQELDAALQPLKITVQERQLPLSAYSKLYVKAPGDTKEVQTASEKAGTDYRLEGIAWSGPCAKSGALQANCKSCWRETKELATTPHG